MEIEVASPEYQAELDNMTVEQLDAKVASEEGAAPPVGEATGQPNGEAVGNKTQNQAPQVDAEPAWFTKFKEENKRELGSFRNLQGLSDKLPALIEKQLNQRLAALQQAQTRANLSPEDQQAQDQLRTQQEALQKFVDERADARAKAQLDAIAGDYLPLLNELKEQKADDRLIEAVSSLVSDIIPDMGKEKFNTLFEGLAEKIEAGDKGALDRFNRLTTDPSFAALELIRMQRGQVQQQAQQVTQKRQNMANQAAQGVKTTAVQSNGKKSLAEMSDAELDAEYDKDPKAFEAAIPAA